MQSPQSDLTPWTLTLARNHIGTLTYLINERSLNIFKGHFFVFKENSVLTYG